MIKLTLEPSILEDGITHTATTWNVSRDPYFTVQEDFILESIEDTTNILNYDLDYSVQQEEVIFVRAKYHFSDSSDTIWTNTISISSNDTEKTNAIKILVTPKLYTENVYFNGKEDVKITTSKLRTIDSAEVCESTTWKIVDSAGNTLWSRERDVNNKEEIVIPKKVFLNLEQKSILTILCKQHSQTGDTFMGKLDINTTLKTLNISIPNTYYIVADDYNNIEVKINDSLIKEFTWALLDSANNVILRDYSKFSRIDIDRADIVGKLVPGEGCKLIIDYFIKYVGSLREEFSLPIIARDMDFIFSDINKVIETKFFNNSIVPTLQTKMVTYENSNFITPVINHTTNAIDFYIRNFDLSIKNYVFNLNNFHQDLMVDISENHIATVKPLGNNIFGITTVSTSGDFHFQVFRFIKNSSNTYNIISKRIYKLDLNPSFVSFKPFGIYDEKHVVFGYYNEEDNQHELIKVNIYTGLTVNLVLPALDIDRDIQVDNYGKNNFIVYGRKGEEYKVYVLDKDLNILTNNIIYNVKDDSFVISYITEYGSVLAYKDKYNVNNLDYLNDGVLRRIARLNNNPSIFTLVTKDGVFTVI